MSEGGQLPWKRQSIDTHRGPSTNYSSIQLPLPNPPKGYAWVCHSETREWAVVPIQEALPVLLTKTKTTAMTGDGGDDDAFMKVENADETINNAVVVSDEVVVEVVESSNPDYITHKVQSADTFQGLCLKYKVSPTKLRQLNHFSGSNLALAPHTLIIPSSSTTNCNNQTSTISPPPPIDPRQKNIHHFLHAIQFEIMDLRGRTGKTNMSTLSRNEAIAYLDMNDWDVNKAVEDAKGDIRWEVTGMR